MKMHQDTNDWSSYLYKLREAELINNLFFTVNHHYLHHIPDIIRMLGPLRMYSARSMERTIGEYKRKIKSSTNPGADAANILKAHAQSRHEHTVASSKRRKQIVTPIDEGDEDSPEYYGRMRTGNMLSSWPIVENITGFKIKERMEVFLRTLETSANKIKVIDNLEFRFNARVWIDGTIYSSKLNKREKRAGYYLRIKIWIDENAHRKGKNKPVAKMFFAKAYLHMEYRPHITDDRALALTLVYVYQVHIDGRSQMLYIQPSAQGKFMIVDSRNIQGYFGLLTASRNRSPYRHYCIWPGMKSTKETISAVGLDMSKLY